MMGSNLNGYTAEEDAIITEIYGTVKTLNSQMHRLPGRTPGGCWQRALYLGLVKKTLMDCVRDLMADGKPRTAAEIEKAIGGRRKYVVEQMRLASNGIDYHICSYEGAGRNFVFKAGPGVNAVRPEPMHTPLKVYQQRRRDRRRDDRQPKPVAKKAPPKKKATRQPVQIDDRAKDEKYRLPETRWPQCDLTAFNAVQSMVRAGRQSA
ncbi:hypothetical protein BX589_102354 [Paraburkholderia fungorum]|uniref:hypothetical protein n=1 Tax=Paraburkholderia fungorum TaxID=134537 RepID=UPI000D42D0F3|nr:hypothetical protein [Paraburkholderia fungorum]PRZ56153.1 hypothetical protein BX589_102354 [Paraburkholderia fungorum]